MTASFDPTKLSPSVFDERIQELEEREGQLQRELTKVSQELGWWRDGRTLFIGVSEDRDAEDDVEDDTVDAAVGEGKTTELVPPNDVLTTPGTRPTLRQAILRCMLDRKPMGGREVQWPVPMVMSELDSKGWMPEGKNAENLVRKMMGDMVKRGQLVRPAYGKYALAPDVRAQELDSGSQT